MYVGAANLARARNIKPGFFTNDELGECEPLARLLFAGLWTIADREGRLEYRPKKIKAEVLPYDDCNIIELLESLNEKGFITIYEVDKTKYVQVNNWTKHQNPHVKEGASNIPAPDQNSTSTVQEPEKNESSPADSLNLIPDSLPTAAADEPKARTDYQGILDEYNATCTKMPKAEALTDNRRKTINARIKEHGRDAITEVFRYASQSPHHNGTNDLGWQASFDWLMGPKNFLKILEKARSGTPPGQKKLTGAAKFKKVLERGSFEQRGNYGDIDINCEHIPEDS